MHIAVVSLPRRTAVINNDVEACRSFLRHLQEAAGAAHEGFESLNLCAMFGHIAVL